MANLRAKNDSSKVFIFSGLLDAERRDLAKKVAHLGGKYIDLKDFKSFCSHIITNKLTKSEKVLGGLATGKWILHTDYIHQSYIAGCWLDEEQYEFCDGRIIKQYPGADEELFFAPRRWRFLLGEHNSAFTGWKVAVIAGAKKAMVIKRLLISGGADVFGIKLPIRRPEQVANTIAYVFVSEQNAGAVTSLMDYGVLCLRPEYIGDYLIKDPPPDIMDYVVQQCPGSSGDTNAKTDNSEHDSFLMASQSSLLSQTSSPDRHTGSPSTKAMCSSPLVVPGKTKITRKCSSTTTVSMETGSSNGSTIRDKDDSPATQSKGKTAATEHTDKTSKSTGSETNENLMGSQTEWESLSQEYRKSRRLQFQLIKGSPVWKKLIPKSRRSIEQRESKPVCKKQLLEDSASNEPGTKDEVIGTNDVQNGQKPHNSDVDIELEHRTGKKEKSESKGKKDLAPFSPITKFFKPVSQPTETKTIDIKGELEKAVANSVKMVKDDIVVKDKTKDPTVTENHGKKEQMPETVPRALSPTVRLVDIDRTKKDGSGIKGKANGTIVESKDHLLPLLKDETKPKQPVPGASTNKKRKLKDGHKKQVNGYECSQADNKMKNTEQSHSSTQNQHVAEKQEEKRSAAKQRNGELEEVLINLKRKKVSACEWVPVEYSYNQREHEDTEDSMCLTVTSTEIIHSMLEEDFILSALQEIKRRISFRCLPQPKTLNVLLFQILQNASSELVANLAYDIFIQVLRLHPPITANLQKIYLDVFSLKLDDESFVMTEWNVILELMYFVMQEEDNQTKRNSRLMFKIIKCMIQQNTQHYLLHHDGESAELGVRPMLMKIFWSPSYHVVFNSRCRQLLDIVLETVVLYRTQSDGQRKHALVFLVAIAGSIEHDQPALMCSLILFYVTCLFDFPFYHIFNSRCRQLLDIVLETIVLYRTQPDGQRKHALYDLLKDMMWFVSMVTEMSRLSESRSHDGIHSLTGETTSIFVHEISKRLIEADLKEPSLLASIMSMLDLPWLCVGVCQQILNTLDDYLLVDEQYLDMKIMTLTQIVKRYFFLLPQFHHELDNRPFKTSISRSNRTEPLRSLSQNKPDNNIENRNLQKKANKKNAKGETPLHTACIKNDVMAVKNLLNVPGIDVNAKDNAGWTPLHEACNHGNLECVQELLKFVPSKTLDVYFSQVVTRKVDLHAGNPEGITPLHDAVLNERIEVCRMLLHHGGPKLLTMKTCLGYTPLDLANTDEMYDLLNSVSDTRFRRSDSQDSSLLSSQESTSQDSPSEDLYMEVLNNEGQTRFANTKSLIQYLHLVSILLQNYIKAKKILTLIENLPSELLNDRKCLSNQCFGNKTVPVMHGENNTMPVIYCDNDNNERLSKRNKTLKEKSLPITHCEKNRVPSKQSDQNERLKVSGMDFETIKNDLLVLRKLNKHIDQFKSHLLKLCKGDDSDIVKTEFTSLQLCVDTLCQYFW